MDLILFNTTTITREVTRINKNTKEGALRYLEAEITNLKHQSDALDYNDPILIENIKSYEAQYIEMQQSSMEESNFLAKFSDYTNPHMPSKAFKPPPSITKFFSEIFSINNPDLLLKNQEQVQNEIHNFYEQLYTRVPTHSNLAQFVNEWS